MFLENVTNPIEAYAALISHYQQRWASYGDDPFDTLVGADTAGYYRAKTSQGAIAIGNR